jgi:hypothetical protein
MFMWLVCHLNSCTVSFLIWLKVPILCFCYHDVAFRWHHLNLVSVKKAPGSHHIAVSGLKLSSPSVCLTFIAVIVTDKLISLSEETSVAFVLDTRFYFQESHVDAKNKVVTTPAFMCEAPLHEIFDGIGTMIAGTLNLVDGK